MASPEREAEFSQHVARLDSMRKYRQMRGEERRMILRVYFRLKLEEERDAAAGNPRASIRVRNRTAELFGRSSSTVGRVLSGWNRLFCESTPNDAALLKYVFEPLLPGNPTEKPKRVPDSNSIVLSVREFVSEKRMNRERVTATEVLTYLIDTNVVSVKKGSNGSFNEKEFSSALRTVRRFFGAKWIRKRCKDRCRSY